MEGWKAGELGRDLEELRGDTLRRIDCKVGFAIILYGGDRGRLGGGGGGGGDERLHSEPKYRNILFFAFLHLIGSFRSYSKTGR